MEIYETQDHYIIQDGEHSLWCDRKTGNLTAKKGEDLCKAWNPICLGTVSGVVGKVQLLPDSDPGLILIKQLHPMGQDCLEHDVYRIGTVVMLPLNSQPPPPDFELQPCKKHHFGISNKPKQITSQGKMMLQSTWNSIKSVKETVQAKRQAANGVLASLASSVFDVTSTAPVEPPVQTTQQLQQREFGKLEKRIVEELLKMFNMSDYYYLSPSADLTNSIQRQNSPNYDTSLPLWQRADQRFFWNKSLLKDLIDSQSPLADHWIQPIILGYFETKTCTMSESNVYSNSTFHSNIFKFDVSIISRRSRLRAGTRYKRRGLDENGDCANYVETEQIIHFQSHTVSYLQLRGSIPVYWSQRGYKYRPPPIIERDEKETNVAFRKHFEQQLQLYGGVTCINLVDGTGREKVMGDVFLRHIVLYNNPEVAYVAFDFHDYCRGMQFDNVSMLTSALQDVIKNHKYCWVDTAGMICEQKAIFRVNCIDCLDRTNVVQTAVAKCVLDQQIRKLGLLTPDEELPESARLVFNKLWANNGDAISRQYAGTAAMKGDYTRTGERKISGLMRDGVKSANRYLINRFRDLYRQAAIDIQLGLPVDSEILLQLTKEQNQTQQDEIDYIREKASDAVTVIEEARTLLIVEPEQYMGGWAVISMDDGRATSQDEMDTILLLTDKNYYIVTYDDELDCLSEYQQVPITDLYAIEIGPAQTSLFRSKPLCIRLWYRYTEQAGYFHTITLPNVRAFNNTLLEVKNSDEVKEILQAVAEAFRGAAQMSDSLLAVTENKIVNKTNKVVPKRSIQSTSLEADVWNSPHKVLANIASSALTKANNMKRSLANLNKKITSSPKHSEQAHVNTSFSEHDSEDFDAPIPDSPKVTIKVNLSLEAEPSNLIKTRTLSLSNSEGSLPVHQPDPAAVPPDSIRNSAPEISHSHEDTCVPSDPDNHLDAPTPLCVDNHSSALDPSSTNRLQICNDLAHQYHHHTAPQLTELDSKNPPSLEASCQEKSSQGITLSLSDESIKTYKVIHPSTSTTNQDRSTFSKLRSGFSTVSQLISNQASSPQAARRKQRLEAQLIDNQMKSSLRFRECKTKIIML